MTILHPCLSNVLLYLSFCCYVTSQSIVVTIGGGHVAGTGIHVETQSYEVPRPEMEAFTTGNVCARETSVSPGTAVAAGTTTSSNTHTNVACANARISNALAQWEFVMQQQGALFDWTGSTILLNVGLDDIVTINGRYTWTQLLNWCELEPFPFIYECHFEESNGIGNLASIQAGLTALVAQMVSDASGATIRVLGYGKIYQPPTGEGERCDSIGMNNPESQFLDDMVEEVNTALSTAVALAAAAATANTVDLAFVNVDNYLTVGNCAGLFAPERHMRGVVLGWFIVPFVSVASYHPTALGYEAYAQAVLDSL